jgi:hypothetical protein
MRTSFPLRLGILGAGLLPVVVVTLASFGGCDPSRITVYGRITADGSPLPGGSIRLVSESADQPSADVGAISDGDYAITDSERLVPGTYIVQILGMGQEGVVLPPGTDTSAQRGSPSWIPDRYNTKSVIRVDIPRGGLHRFNFDLKL